MVRNILSYIGEVFRGWIGSMSALFGLILSILGWFFIADVSKLRPYVFVIGIVALIYAFYRAWLQKNNQLIAIESELRAEIARLRVELEQTTPFFTGEIEKALAGGLNRFNGCVSGFVGCEIMVMGYFANIRPVPTTLVKLQLEVRIGEKIHHANLSKRPCMIFREMYDLPYKPLKEHLDDAANQGRLFKGYLSFTLPDVIIADGKEVEVLILSIKDASGLIHEVKPQGRCIVELAQRPNIDREKAHALGNLEPRLAVRYPPAPMPSVELSGELKSLLRKAFGPSGN